ncbi:hypothetical protein DAETH_32560 (plasmid) [Deinococcus aetherius]|uniref:Uncharacterized protein n=1 Tax=Deinococcus aetherius TaxID=200252 RepID=A0ABM8AHJ6_9DEIO|nr:hypothetical protein DAETH_32560 [Deinococcus aetherius]
MGGRQVEQHTRADGAGGDPRVQPADEPERLRVVERPVIQVREDQSLMLETRIDLPEVLGQHLGVEVQLVGDVLKDDTRNVGGRPPGWTWAFCPEGLVQPAP